MSEPVRPAAELIRLKTPAAWLAARGVADGGLPAGDYLANMGIYLFNREALDRLLAAFPKAMDLVREVLAHSLKSHRLHAYLFTGYWDDLGSIRSYHEAHMALAGDRPPFDFAGVQGFVYTRMRNLPAARVHSADVEQCLLSDGCLVLPGAKLQRCVVGVRSRIGRNVVLRETVVNGADRYETDAERADNKARGLPDLGIGDGSVIERAVIDKDCRIGKNVRIINRHRVRDGEGPNFVIRDGIVVVPNETTLADGSVI